MASECLKSLVIVVTLRFHIVRRTNNLDRFLKAGRKSKALTKVDDILQEQRLSNVEACGVFLLLEFGATADQSMHKDVIKKGRECWFRLVRKKMPQSSARGILSYAIHVSVDSRR